MRCEQEAHRPPQADGNGARTPNQHGVLTGRSEQHLSAWLSKVGRKGKRCGSRGMVGRRTAHGRTEQAVLKVWKDDHLLDAHLCKHPNRSGCLGEKLKGSRAALTVELDLPLGGLLLEVWECVCACTPHAKSTAPRQHAVRTLCRTICSRST